MKPCRIRTTSFARRRKSVAIVRRGWRATKSTIFFAVLMFLAFWLAYSGRAEVPHMINYQGTLTDTLGAPITGDYEMTFSIYDAPTEGVQLWTETHDMVPVEEGIFNVLLGIPASVFDGSVRYLGVTVGTDDEMTPRRPVVSVGYAFHAESSDTSAYARAAEPDDDWLMRGDTAYHDGNVGVEGNVHASGTIRSGNSLILDGTTDRLITTSGQMYFGRDPATGDFGDVKVGVGTTSPNQRLDVDGKIEVGDDATAATAGAIRWTGANFEGHDGSSWKPLDVQSTSSGGWTDAGTAVGLTTSSDSVGIGTTSPQAKLHVKGGLERAELIIESTAYPTLWLHDGSGVKGFLFYDHLNGGTNLNANGMSGAGLVVRNDNSVGIGTTAPTEKLDVVGNIRARGSITSGNSITIDGVDDKITATSGKIDFDNDSLVTMGAVGIGNTSPAEKLDVAGTAQVTGFKMPTGASSGYVLTSDASGVGTWQAAAGGADNDWAFRVTDSADTTLTTGGGWGIARFGNVLYGNKDSTHVNLGVACTTGANGQNHKYCAVGGGRANSASHEYAIVAGGLRNAASGFNSTVGGGQSDTASGSGSTVGGGTKNVAWGDGSVVAGGYENAADAYGAIGGGSNNAAGASAAIGGGAHNTASGQLSTVAGGMQNAANGQYGAVGGGQRDTASGRWATVGGGYLNTASGDWGSTVSGGYENRASGDHSIVCGGRYNTANGYQGIIVGGSSNIASGDHSIVVGGYGNKSESIGSVVLGGSYNTLTIPGGLSMAFGENMYLSGSRRVAFFERAFHGKLGINRDDHDGGILHPIHVGTHNGNGNGAHLTAGGVWTNGSSREFKEKFEPFDGQKLLSKISDMPVESWQFKDSDERHVGPVAEDFVGAFDVGTVREDGTRENQYLAAGDVAGVALAGVKELAQQNRELRQIIEELRRRIADLEKKK